MRKKLVSLLLATAMAAGNADRLRETVQAEAAPHQEKAQEETVDPANMI